MSLVSLIKGRRGPSGFGYASTAEEVTRGIDLAGTNILITGVGSGLGLESARVLASRGARILGCARTEEKAAAVLASLSAPAEGHVPLACELSDPVSIRACVAAIESAGLLVDVLMANAGIMALPKRETIHGHELQFFTNHVGHSMLVLGLLDRLSERARVVMLSSSAHTMAPPAGIEFDDLSFEKGYSPWTAYGQSKLANLLFARALARRFAGTKRTANAVHPGVIRTNLGRHMGFAARASFTIASAVAFKDVHEGAATQCYAAVHPSLESVSGEYFADCNVEKSSRHSRDEALGERLFALTEQILADL